MANQDINLVIGGEAGQGLATIGQLLARSLVRSGYSIVVTQSYQSRIRGGHNTFAIRVSTRTIAAPGELIDILIALDRQTMAEHETELARDGLIIVDEALGLAGDRVLKVPFRELGSARSVNIIALGLAAALLGLEEKIVSQVMADLFESKHVAETEANLSALRQAYHWPGGREINSFRLEKRPNPEKKMMLTGNEAIALGALAAGVKFCSFYPMTPSTSINLTLAAQAERMGLIVEQAEDEIAAINMALGASFAGAPSLVATSGGGFALMTEGVSLSAMTETPLVIVVAQRPGPATGLPTRTSQGDLDFVLHAGHGEFPRAVFAPGSVEDCFSLTRAAFSLAERSQGPVFILTDQFLADSYRDVAMFDVDNMPAIGLEAERKPGAVPYQRYQPAPEGVSPRLIPGLSKHLVVADSDAHTADGHLTEDLKAAREQMDKRLRKMELLSNEAAPPEYRGDPAPEILLVSWGSSQGAVREAADILARDDRRRAGTLHFSQVWPLNPEYFLDTLKAAGEVVSVEGNAFGQFARLIRRETGFEMHRRISRYDGLPLASEYILAALRPV